MTGCSTSKIITQSDRVMNLTKKSEAINFRTLVDTKELYKTDIQIVGVINYETAFRRDWLAEITGVYPDA